MKKQPKKTVSPALNEIKLHSRVGAKKQPKKPKFEVDFFLLEILTEACWHAGTIVRATFLEELVDVHYHNMSEQQKASFWQFLKRFDRQESTAFNNVVHELVFCRFNPERQFEITTDYNGKTEIYKAFLMSEKYHVSKSTDINPKFIKEVKLISASM